jgi:dUTP pyrophosphatase
MKIKLLHPLAKIPTFANYGDAGADLYSVDNVILEPGKQRLIQTGVAIEIPFGYFGLVRPRSGLATKLGIGMNSSGVIDSGYRGEIGVTLINHSDLKCPIVQGERIAQIVFLPYLHVEYFEEVEELSESVRGQRGYGSTGGWAS